MRTSFYRRLQSDKPHLRVGLLLNSTSLPLCFVDVVDHMIQSDFAELDLLVFNNDVQREASPPPGPRSAASKVLGTPTSSKKRRRLLFTLDQRWDQRNINPADDPLAPVDCSSRFEKIESNSVTPITKRFVHRFPAESIERIRGARLDVLIRFGFNILRGDILTAARYGVWSYHHDDNDHYRGGPAYF